MQNSAIAKRPEKQVIVAALRCIAVGVINNRADTEFGLSFSIKS